MNIDFPLVLVIIVLGSGTIWLLDSLLLASGRSRRRDELARQYLGHEQEGSKAAQAFSDACAIETAEPTVVEYARSFFPVLAVVLILRSFLYEPFQIPSSSMVPTLEVGDYILVDKFSYGLRLPVTRTKIFETGSPERGDVMVFFPPHENDTYYIKRVIGKPGDKIAYRGKQLYVNGEPVPQEWLAELPSGRYSVKMGREALPGSDGYLMRIDNRRGARNFSVVVKPGHYFMMGDNRDNSSDSRVWGQVPEKDIVGKAVAIWMHWEDFLSVPSFSRSGAID
ncbi:MAG: signal peptidase I [Luminiphilus sp.]|nr:signal peptidase I [Luminiphilus sp.]